MQSEFLKQATIFDTAPLYPGKLIYLIEPSQCISSSEKVHNALVKSVTSTELTIIRINDDDEVEEKTYPVEYFEGIGAMKFEIIPKREKEKK
ncbi:MULTISPECIES: hypothetical protein [Bacillus]|uniref:Uncharacterized protein n=2 Tax=Bacillus thuringiensis TaxID=1428 RepID=A0AAP4Q7B4_BACTU|nr:MULTISPECIES: hypothetical protein [Bacillus]MCU5282257.1 hypothetical protein [Bacillus cereus]AFV21619.1 hypothetical protein BTB_502p03140 [Bacillus thuringiensis Bt407]EEM25352.1 hypothetical protein bthur0002_59940 [Bacillus thuringiensis Bt407]ERI01205.1 hypothetical protein BTCBT_002760 [Bacillus thuringiensis T01-328]MBN6707956.1 hypothetical protein [Bacillus thuringiensis]